MLLICCYWQHIDTKIPHPSLDIIYITYLYIRFITHFSKLYSFICLIVVKLSFQLSNGNLSKIAYIRYLAMEQTVIYSWKEILFMQMIKGRLSSKTAHNNFGDKQLYVTLHCVFQVFGWLNNFKRKAIYWFSEDICR